MTGAASGMGLEVVRKVSQDSKYRPIFEPLQHPGIVPLQVDIRQGFDAQLGNVLVRTVPYWRQIFFLGSYGVYELVKESSRFKKLGVNEN